MLFKKTAGRARLPFLLAALLVSAAGHASSSLIQKAQQDLVGGNAAAAFESLQAAEVDHAGDAEFDYWLGLTANRAGKSGHAVFALERVLAQKPNHAAARLELAVAYARLGQGDSARRELDTLDGMNPPEAAQKQIAELRRQLGLGDRAKRLEKRVGYVSLELGHDDNPGSWPDVTVFGAINSVETTYGQLAAGVRQRLDVAADQKVFLSLNAQGRIHQEKDAEQFDQTYLGGRAEWVKDRDGRSEWMLAADAGFLQLDGESYYNNIGLEAEWRKQNTDRTRTLLTFGLRDMNFEVDTNNYLSTRVRAGVRHQLNRQWRVEGDLTLEHESEENGRQGGDALRVNLRTAASWQYRSGERLGADLTYTRIGYDTDMADFLGGIPTPYARNDDRLLYGIQWEKSFRQFWQARARAQYRDQSSTHATYEYDQTNISLSLTRYF